MSEDYFDDRYVDEDDHTSDVSDSDFYKDEGVAEDGTYFSVAEVEKIYKDGKPKRIIIRGRIIHD